MEPLSTILAGVGPGVRMDEEVSGEGRAPLETFATLITLKKKENLRFNKSSLLGFMAF